MFFSSNLPRLYKKNNPTQATDIRQQKSPLGRYIISKFYRTTVKEEKT